MSTIEEEFPTENELHLDRGIAEAYTRLRARAVAMERENRFLSWHLACAEGRWIDARKLEREGAIDGQNIAHIMGNLPLPPAP